MAPVQTTYSENMRAAVAGHQANMEPARMISRNVETEAGVGLGRAVAQGVDDFGCKAFGNGDTAVLGITVLERSLRPESPNIFAQRESARIMTSGCIWVVCATGASAGDGVFVRPSNGDFQDSNTNSAVAIAGARWDTSPGAGQLGIVRLTQ